MAFGDSPIPFTKIDLAIKIARLAGVDIPGFGDILGGLGGIFGGSKKRGVPVGGRAIDDAPISGFLQSLQKQTGLKISAGARDFRRFRNTGLLGQEKAAANRALEFTIGQIESLGVKEIADQLRTIGDKAGGVPSSPQDSVNRTDRLLEALNFGSTFIDDMFKSTGDFPDIEQQIRQEQGQFIAGINKRNLSSRLEIFEADERLFGQGRSGQVRFDDQGDIIVRNTDSREFSRLRSQDAGFQKILDTPAITAIRPVFSDFYRSITSGGQPPQPTQPPQERELPNISLKPIRDLLKPPVPQQSQQFRIPSFDFQFPDFFSDLATQSTLGGGDSFDFGNLTQPQAQRQQSGSGIPFSPTGGNLFSSRQKPLSGLAFLS